MQQCPNDCSQQSSNISIVESQDIIILSVIGITINGFVHPVISSEVINIDKMTLFDIVDVILSYHCLNLKRLLT